MVVFKLPKLKDNASYASVSLPEVPSARMMQWRIGVNLGDVVEEEGKIYGDGVDTAATVEKLAEPGGISYPGAPAHEDSVHLSCF